MITMIRSLFAKLARIPLSADESYSDDTEPLHETLVSEVEEPEPEMDEKKLRRMTIPDPLSLQVPAAGPAMTPAIEEEDPVELAATLASPTKQERPKEVEPVQEQTQVPEPPASKPLSFAPMDVESFGLPALTEILRVLVSLLDPRNTQNTDAMRLLAMTILTSLFETSGAAIVQFPTLRAILQDSACRHLLQLARSENSSVTTYALRALNTLFEVAGQHLKLQFEFFLKFLLDKLAPNFAISLEPWNDQATTTRAVDNAANGTPTAPIPPPPPPLPKTSDRAPATGESRELLLETLCNLLDLMDRHGDANITLWANYDADTECDNLFERLISFWSRAIFAQPPGEQGQDSLQIMALDALLKLVSRLAGRQDPTYQSVAWPTGLPDAKQLEHQKSRKAAILAGAARFNAKPKDGLAYMEREGLIEAKTYGREAAIARFLKECPGLDKKLLGEFIAQPNNAKILEEFIALFDFTDKNVADAMREMLESFRLPGEAHPIAQITETFAKAYAGTGSKEVADQDAVYVLAYSVIMLNTDLHNPQNKKRRMTAEDYRRNLRGVNGGKDFDIEYLNNIYESIRRREIIMPEEHMGALGFDYSWKELLRRSRTAGQLIACDTNIFDTSVFARSWRPIVAALAHAFSTYQDEHLLERSIAGFRQCAALASTFGMVELFDFMVKTLAGATGLLEDSIATGPINNAQVEAEGQKLTVGPLSVGFGVNFKGQMAAVVLFTIANGNGDAMRTSWPELLQILKNLFVHSLLPDEMRKMFLFGQDPEEIPLRPKRLANAPAPDPRAQGGLFSTLSSYLMAPSASPGQGPPPPDVTDEDIESTLCTIDCIASCRIDDMFAQISTLSPESLQCAVAAAKEMADKHTTERLVNARRASEAPTSGTSTPQTSVLVRGQLPYDPCAIFSQEMLAGFTCNAPACPDDAWISAVQHFSSILSEPQRFHPLLVERAVVSLLRLISMPRSGPGRDQALITLDTMRSIPAELRPALVEQIVLGLSHALSQGASVATTATEWNLIISLIADCAFARNAGAAQHAFRTVKQLAEGGLTVDNYAGVIALLRDIAGAADVVATAHRERRDSQRRTLTEKKEQAEYDEVSKKRGQEAVAALEATKAQIPRLITESGRLDGESQSRSRLRVGPNTDILLLAGWRYFWMPLMDALAQQCVNGFRPVRQAAIGHLQKVLLAPQVLSGEHVQLALIFEEIIFPALSELLKPQVFQRDSEPGGMQETRMRMCNMLCKIFLHYLVQLNESAQELNDLWLKVLDFYDRFLNCGKRDQLAESLPETVKNILLVMQASDILVPPPPKGAEEHRSPAQQELWKITQERVSKFLPALLDEVVSRAEPAPAPAAEELAPASAPVAEEEKST